MLQIEGLSVHYGRAQALWDVSIECGEAELVSIVGPNGAGKSSLMNAAAGGLESGTAAGSVRFKGEEILGRAPEAIVRGGLSLVPEGRRILGSLTVAENLSLVAGRLLGEDDLFAPVDDIFPELKTFASKPAGLLSGGQQQQLAISRALLAKPDMLLMDEPSLGLSPNLIDQLFATIEGLKESGIGIVLVEQHARRALRVADKTYVLHKGAIIAKGEREDEARLEAAYWGERSGSVK